MVIKIRDNGIGIPFQIKENLFWIFGNFDFNQKSLHSNGIGLGLTVCKGLTEGLGGEISVRS